MRGVHNILAMLKNSAGFTAEQVDALQDSFASGESGNLEFSINGVSYYMVYGSASFQNWTILGIAPKSVVNANMNRLQYTTMAVMSSIVGMLAVTACCWWCRATSISCGKRISSCWRARSCSQAFPATWTTCS